MSKGLESLEELKKQFGLLGIKSNPYLKIIEKELKALEILKECLIVNDKGKYIEIACEFSIPNKEKYDLLKEVLL